jgi:hypothetical protein
LTRGQECPRHTVWEYAEFDGAEANKIDCITTEEIMPDKEKKGSEFKVSDRRLFTADGELRSETDEVKETQKTPAAHSTSQATLGDSDTIPSTSLHSDPVTPRHPEDTPAPPAPAEQEAQNEAYKQSTRDLDSQVELSGHSAKQLEVNFEGFLASLYMSAMLQLGVMHEQGKQPMVDLIGARGTIDTLGMLADKTKGNLTSKEESFLQNCLYELRMAYVEVTNALARGPHAPGSSTGTEG